MIKFLLTWVGLSFVCFITSALTDDSGMGKLIFNMSYMLYYVALWEIGIKKYLKELFHINF